MTTSWVVTTGTERVALNAQRQGEITFTVTNTTDAADRAVFEPVPGEGVDRAALTVENPDRTIPGRGSAAFLVRIAIPQQAAAGRFELYGQAYSAHLAPEETVGRSGRVVFEVPAAPEPKKRPWWLLAVAALVVIVLAVVGWLVFGRGGPAPTPSASHTSAPSLTPSPTPKPQPTPICSATITLQGTFSLDAGGCRQAAASATGDLFWEQATSVVRSLNPVNGAAAARLGILDFAGVTPQQLSTTNYSAAPIDGPPPLTHPPSRRLPHPLPAPPAPPARRARRGSPARPPPRPRPRRRCPRFPIRRPPGPRWWERTAGTTTGFRRSPDQRAQPSRSPPTTPNAVSSSWGTRCGSGGAACRAAWLRRST